MWEHWKEIAAFVAILTAFFGVYKYFASRITTARDKGKEEGKEDGSLSSQVCAHKKWLQGHEGRLHELETAGFMTDKEHDEESDKCQKEMNRRLTENHDNLEKLTETVRLAETRRQAYRDEDNKWKMGVTDSLARLETMMSKP